MRENYDNSTVMPARILMVDDEPDAELLFRQQFRKETRRGTYALDFARSGGEALRVLQSEAEAGVALVLSDINMPGMTGIELLDQIKANWPELAVIMITAYGDQATAEKVRHAGATGFMTKPVDFARLKAEITASLTRRQGMAH